MKEYRKKNLRGGAGPVVKSTGRAGKWEDLSIRGRAGRVCGLPGAVRFGGHFEEFTTGVGGASSARHTGWTPRGAKNRCPAHLWFAFASVDIALSLLLGSLLFLLTEVLDHRFVRRDTVIPLCVRARYNIALFPRIDIPSLRFSSSSSSSIADPHREIQC